MATEGVVWLLELAAALKAELGGEPGEGLWFDGRPPDLAGAVAADAALARAVNAIAPRQVRAAAERLRRRWGTRDS
jgi:hypothetical protein